MDKKIKTISKVKRDVHVRISGVSDLIAAERKYHLHCLVCIERDYNKMNNNDSLVNDIAMTWLCNELQDSSAKGNVLKIDDVWVRYEELCEEAGTCPLPSYISRRASFKEKLEVLINKVYQCLVPLQGHPSERKTVLIPLNFAERKLEEIIHNDDEKEELAKLHIPAYKAEDDIFLSLLHVAIKLRSD